MDYEKFDMSSFIDDMIKEQKKDRELFLEKGESVFELVDEKGSVMDDDNLYSNDEELHKLDELVRVFAEECLSYCKTKRIIYSDEICFVAYKNKVYSCEEVHGQGSFRRVELVKKEEVDIRRCVNWEEIIDFFNENTKNKERAEDSESVIIENPGYNKWDYISEEEKTKFIKSISLWDMAVYRSADSFIEGKIEIINNNGLEIVLNKKHTYVRWHKIKRIIK